MHGSLGPPLDAKFILITLLGTKFRLSPAAGSMKAICGLSRDGQHNPFSKDRFAETDLAFFNRSLDHG